ncbi:hypothetical protein BD410DRAFT_430953 [Rickenella mellea]|uniref:Uncharacterized protein n=1 Tax=Rickenella mellea TaxID=50990 RepID=A0A4Y7QLC9_9AGAM|nr:hypothetical protein BD410DRAFT_430953 [Rickenella mellea]
MAPVTRVMSAKVDSIDTHRTEDNASTFTGTTSASLPSQQLGRSSTQAYCAPLLEQPRASQTIPAANLPADVLLLIFNDLRDRSNDLPPWDWKCNPERSPSTIRVSLAWIRVTHVCQCWRQIALQCATLWTAVSDTQTDEIATRASRVPMVFISKLLFV